MTQILELTRGLPASGKSTYAHKKVKEDPSFIRLNRDDFRQMLFGKAVLDANGETLVTIAQHGAIDNALKSGKNVIVDDTNFFARGVNDILKIAAKYDVEVVFTDFTDVPLEECIRRDEIRRTAGQSNFSSAVGEKVIRGMYDRYLKGRKLPLPIPAGFGINVEPYSNPTNLPNVVIVDIDGTLAKMSGRSPYDWKRVGEDSPVMAVVGAVYAAAYRSKIIVMSGRDSLCRDITEKWLTTHLIKTKFELFMRAEGDNRKDDLVKYELFNKHIRGKYHVNYILDDRDQVVRMWRKLGLAAFQVAPGDF